jgi:hypothetical protein
MGTSTRIGPQHQWVRKTLVDITIKNGNFQESLAAKAMVPALVVVNSYHNPQTTVFATPKSCKVPKETLG